MTNPTANQPSSAVDEFAKSITDELAYRALLNQADDDASVEDTVAHEQRVEHDVAAYITERLTSTITAQEQALEKLREDNKMLYEANRGLDASRTNLINQIENAENKIEQQEQRIGELEAKAALGLNAGDALVKMVRKLEEASGRFISSVHFYQAKDNLELLRAALENSKPAAWLTERAELTAQVEGLTAERDHYRAALAAIKIDAND